MAMVKYARAQVTVPDQSVNGWGKVRTASAKNITPSKNLIHQASEILGETFDPTQYLLTHCSIVASVDTYVPEGDASKLGKVAYGGKTIHRKYANYRIKPDCDQYINNNLDSWDRNVLLKAYDTFVGGHNFCFAPGTGVLMHDRTYKPIEEVQIGDKVVTHEGRVREVTHVFERDYEGDIQSIHVDRFKDPILVTGNHPFSAISVSAPPCKIRKGSKTSSVVRYRRDQITKFLRDGKGAFADTASAEKQWTRSDQLEKGSYLLGPKNTTGTISRHDEASLLGYYVAEGCPLSPHKDYGFVLSFGKHEKGLVSHATRLAERVFPEARVEVRDSSTTTRVEVFSAKASRWAVKMGGHLAPSKELHPSVFDWDGKSLLSLLGTWLSGDGDFHRGTLRLRGCSTSKRLSYQMQAIAEMVGVKSSVVLEKLSVGEVQSQVQLVVGGQPQTFDVIPRHDKWTLIVSKGSVNKIAASTKRWGAPLTLVGRKRSEFAWWEGHRVHRVSSNTTIPYSGKVYNIEVEEDHSYVVDYGLAVHNCEHVQVEDLSKGRIIDAVARDIGSSVYVDILVATHKKHTDLIRKIKSGEMNTLSMGCFLPGTQVTMADGTRIAIEDVQPGDMVLTHKGRPREVLNKQIRKGIWDMRRISARGLPSSISATGNHPFYVMRPQSICACGCGESISPRNRKDASKRLGVRFKPGHQMRILNPNGSYSLEEFRERRAQLDEIQSMKLEKVRADELQVGDYVAFPRSSWGEQHISPGKARLLGYFLAEGSFLKRKGEPVEVQFNFSFEEKETYVQEVVDLLKAEFPDANEPWVQDREDRTTCVVHVYGRDIADWFYRMGGEYSNHKRLHPDVLGWDREAHLNLVGAWLNGDGGLTQNGTTCGVTTSYALVCQMQAITSRLGLPAWWYCRVGTRTVELSQVVNGGVIERDTETGKLPAFSIEIGKLHSGVLSGYCDKIDPSFSQTDQIRVQDDYVIYPISEIQTFSHEGWVYDMEVDEDHTYIAEGMSVSNCTIDFSQCTKCGNVAVDETEMCDHIKYEKGNIFYDENGQQHRVAELCFPPGYRVVMADGTRQAIEDIQLGDQVMTHKGRVRDVVELYQRHYEGELITVDVMGLPQTLKSTPNHPYWVISPNETCACGCGTPLKARTRFSKAEYTRKWAVGHHPNGEGISTLEIPDFSFKEAKDLKRGDLLALPVPKDTVVPTDVNENRARLLGWFLAEGSYLKHEGERVGVQFTLNANDEGHVAEFLAELLEQEFSPEPRSSCTRAFEEFVPKSTPLTQIVLEYLHDNGPCLVRKICADLNLTRKQVESVLTKYRKKGEVRSWKPSLQEKSTLKVANIGQAKLWALVGDPVCARHRKGLEAHEAKTQRLYESYVKSVPHVYQMERGTEPGEKLVVNYTNRKAARWFFTHAGEYSAHKRLSEKAVFWPVSLQQAMLTAYVRGDGTQDVFDRFQVSSISETLISQMQIVAARCGLWTRRQVIFEGKSVQLQKVVNGSSFPVGDDGCRPRHELHFQPSDRTTSVFSWDGTRHDRKISPAWRAHEGYLLYRVDNVGRQYYAGTVCNIEVEEDHSYLVEGMSVHNCGHHSVDPDGGVQFIEASWVATPAFKGAVMRNILNADFVSNEMLKQAQEVLNTPPREWVEPDKVARTSLAFGFDDEEEEGEGGGEDAPGNPLEDATREVADYLIKNVKKELREKMKGQQPQIPAEQSTAEPNDNIIKQSMKNPLQKRAFGYKLGIQSILDANPSEKEVLHRLASLNRAYGIEIPSHIYKAAYQVGATSKYASLYSYILACKGALGRTPTISESKTLIRIGKLLSITPHRN